MPWSGAGIYNLPPAFTPEVNGTVIDATRYNGTTSDIATGITVAIAKDGQNVPTANLPMGGFKHTGVADANGTGQYIAFNQATTVGSLTITTLTVTTLSGATVTATGNFAVTGNLAVDGNTTLGNAAGDALTITPSAVTWSNNPTHSGNHTYSGNLSVNGNTTLGNAGTDTVTTNGNATFNAPTSGNTLQIASVANGRAIDVSSSISGNSVDIVLTNSSNTATSDARFVAVAGGTSSGDPFSLYSVTGGTAWAVGVDNSDSDIFKFDATSALTTTTNRLNITNDGRIYGNALHNNAGAVTGTTNQYIASGTYTPTLNNTTNVASSSVSGTFSYTRVGNVVAVAGRIQVDASGTGAVVVEVTLPIASNLTAVADCCGSGNSETPASHTGGGITADTITDEAKYSFTATTDPGSIFHDLIFQYVVL